MTKKISFILLLSAILSLLSSCREGFTTPFYVGCLADAEPFAYVDENGQLTGIEIDIVNEIAKDQGIWFEFITSSQQGILGELDSKRHKMDCGLGMIEWTTEREKKYTFVSPEYYTSSISLATLKTSDKIKSLTDMAGKVMAVKAGSLAEEYALSISGDYGFTVKSYDTFDAEVKAVETGEADAIQEHYPILKYRIDKKQANIKIVDKGIQNISFAFITQLKEDKTLRGYLFHGLANIINNGTMDEIIQKYLPEE